MDESNERENEFIGEITYEFMELLECKKALKNKWVFKHKKDREKLVKYKACLVVKGFN